MRQEFIRNDQGVALLEVLISILMLALGVLALIGLQAAMSANSTDAKFRAEASYLATQLVGQMWVDQANLSQYVVSGGACAQSYVGCTTWLATVQQRLPAGGAVVTINGNAVSVTVTWQMPGGATHRYLLSANVVA